LRKLLPDELVNTTGEHQNELSFAAILRDRADRHPDRVLLVDGLTANTRTYAEHHCRLARVIGALRALGVGPDDRYAVLADTSMNFIELWHAAFLGGGIIVPLNVRLHPAELTVILRDSGAKILFVGHGLESQAATIASALPQLAVIPCEGSSATGLDSIVESATPLEDWATGELRSASLLYTAGTTGDPKGVLLSQRAHILNQYHAQMVAPMGEGWTYLQHTPLFHAGAGQGLIRVPLMGCRAVLLPRFDASAFLATVEQYEVNATVMLPTLLGMVLRQPDFDPARLASLRRITYGGSPMSPSLMRSLGELLPNVELIQAYGMTEACSTVTLLSGEDHRAEAHAGSVGRAMPGVQLRIVDAEDNPMPDGQTGEICVRGANIMDSYWNRPEQTRQVLRQGWYHTGDVGYRDAAGYLYVLDRLKDLIVTGGENVYSTEVERALESHPAIMQAVVVGVPDETWGEAVHAIIVTEPGQEISAESACAHVAGRLARYKVPKTVAVQHEPFALSGANKVQKAAVKSEYLRQYEGS